MNCENEKNYCVSFCFSIQFKAEIDKNTQARIYSKIILQRSEAADIGEYWCEVDYEGVTHIAERKKLAFPGVGGYHHPHPQSIIILILNQSS